MVSRPSAFHGATDAVPAPVRLLLARLLAGGHEAVLVGGCVRDLVRGARVTDFDVATSAPPEAVLALFPRAIPIGLHHGTVMIPTATGPVDVTTYRAGPRLDDDLAHRDFTVNAMAWDPVTERLIDPYEGRADLRAGRLRAVGDPRARLGEDPLRALRAARMVASLELEPDAPLEEALAAAAARLEGVARERIRRELEALLLAPRAGAGLALLRRTGLERALLSGQGSPDAPGVVDRVPVELPIRLAAWLRGLDPRGPLARLRFSRGTVQETARLLDHHPLDDRADPGSEVTVRRLLRRVGEERVGALFALREAELAETPDAAAHARLAALRETVARVRRSGALALRRRDLALDGRAVMTILGCGPGPHVGSALDFLTEEVIREPACNTPEGLRARLEAWWRASPAATPETVGRGGA